jgi:hypothetical protein
MRLNKSKMILLLVVLMTGMSITGWSISTHYDQDFINGKVQEEMKNDEQSGSNISGVFTNNNTILILVSTGLVGLVGVRRHRSISKAF